MDSLLDFVSVNHEFTILLTCSSVGSLLSSVSVAFNKCLLKVCVCGRGLLAGIQLLWVDKAVSECHGVGSGLLSGIAKLMESIQVQIKAREVIVFYLSLYLFLYISL